MLFDEVLLGVLELGDRVVVLLLSGDELVCERRKQTCPGGWRSEPTEGRHRSQRVVWILTGRLVLRVHGLLLALDGGVLGLRRKRAGVLVSSCSGPTSPEPRRTLVALSSDFSACERAL